MGLDCRIYGPDGEIYATIDQVDYAWAAQWRWSPKWSRGGTKVYMRRVSHEGSRLVRVQRTVWLHRAIIIERMGIQPPGPEYTMVDHENGDELDCRRFNLRWVTPKMNAANRRVNKIALARFLGLDNRAMSG